MTNPCLVDYHLHTSRCGHAVGGIGEYIDRAKTMGLTEIGFADHLPLFHTIDATLAMSWDELPLYLADIAKLKKSLAEPKVKLGIEVDFIPKYVDRIRAALDDYDFDYILGAVHFVDGWGIDDRRYLDNYGAYKLEDLFERYFDLLVQAARSGLFDVLAHADLIKKYYQLTPEPLELFERAAAGLAETGIAIEVSSAGLRKPCREAYPGLEFLKICRRYEIPVTLGSDAHAPEQVGFRFKYLLEQLKAAGYSAIVTFEGRQRRMVEIDWSLLERLPAGGD